MKKTLILIFTSITTLSFGQYKPRFFEYGPKIGLNVNTIAIIDNPTAIEPKLGLNYQAGIFTRFNVGKLSLQPEVVYQQKGSTLKTPSEKHSYKYISAPVLLGFTPLKGIYLEAGPEYSWALNAGYKKDGTSIYGPDKDRDLCLVVGTRINMLDMFSLLSVNIRYAHGLVNTTNRKSNTTPLDFRTRTFQLSVTYSFSEYYRWQKKDRVKKKKD